MLTVATSQLISGPTRLLYPRFSGSVGEASDFPFSLLGARGSPHALDLPLLVAQARSLRS